ncbi:MAG: hypothetical protein ACI8PZ_006551 [Myxococcota bacterium]|jgi:hypothetical protein
MPALVLWLMMLPDVAAAFPETVAPSGMVDQDGEVVLDPALLGASWQQLVKELGTAVSNKPITPAATLGLYGWEVAVWSQFWFIQARDRGGEPSPWDRSWADENPPEYLVVPTIGMRKGLPLSTEAGFNVGWIANSSTGVVSGYGRVAVLEAYRPAPDLSLQIGYSGYVGNDEMELGVLDLGITLGTTALTGTIPGVSDAEISPWVNFTTLRISASPRGIDEAVLQDIGAAAYKRGTEEDLEAPLVVPQIGAGLQVVAQSFHVRTVITWAPATIPTVSAGMGFTF